MLEHVLIFANAYLALNHDNKLAVIASHAGSSRFLYPRDGVPKDTLHMSHSDGYQQFFNVNNAIMDGIKHLMAEGSQDGDINRFTRLDTTGTLRPRILIISAAPDSSHQYISTMNCIFSAQRLSIPIDVCRVAQTESIFLQQAAHLTSGVYLRVSDLEALLQNMLVSFLPDRFARLILRPVTVDTVDFRAACFCHKRIIDVGFVCSVCLSIYCESVAACATCKTEFPATASRQSQPKPQSNGSQAIPIKQNPK
ncbi:RNA polymerase II transcription factor B subunit 4 [Sorochytrium milnesiophthora]